MQASVITAAILVGALVLQVGASAPRCKFDYVKKKGFQAPYGCPADEPNWTHCCIVPMSKFDPKHPRPGPYTGVCAVDPMIRVGEPDICRPLSNRHYDWNP